MLEGIVDVGVVDSLNGFGNRAKQRLKVSQFDSTNNLLDFWKYAFIRIQVRRVWRKESGFRSHRLKICDRGRSLVRPQISQNDRFSSAGSFSSFERPPAAREASASAD